MTPRIRTSWILCFTVIGLCGLLINCGTGPTFSSQNGNNSQAASGDNIRPSAPPGSPHTVTLSWQPSRSSNVVGYNVYRGAQPGNYGLVRSMQSSTRYVDATVQDGNTYYYIVTAVNSSGDESPSSNVAAAVVPSAGDPTAGHTPADPQPAGRRDNALSRGLSLKD